MPCDGSRVELRDGDTIAVDWHYTVYAELVDSVAACEVKEHPSVKAEATANEHVSTSYSRLYN